MKKTHNSDYSVKFSLLRKVLTAYVILIICPVFVLSFYTYHQNYKRVMDNLLMNTRDFIRVTESTIETRIQLIENTATYVVLNPRMILFLQTPFVMNTESYNEYATYIDPLVRYAQTYNSIFIRNVRIYMKNDSIPEGFNRFFSWDRIADKDWIDEFTSSEKQDTWFVLSDPALFSTSTNYTEGKYLSYATIIEEVGSQVSTLLGILVFDISLDELMENFYVSGQHYFLRISANDVIIFNSFPDDFDYKAAEGLLIHEKIPKLNIDLTTAIQPDRKTMFNGVFLPVLLLVPVLVSAFLIFFYLLHKLKTRVKYNVSSMHRVIQEGFTYQIPIQDMDEFGEITQEFNYAIREINNLVDTVINKELEQQKAQLHALEYQINPHFIYNVLEVFRMRMEISGNYELSDTMADFGKMLRYNLNDSGTHFSSLGDELHHIERYVSLQHLRFKDKINYATDVDSQLYAFPVMKFLLQPLVENCFSHGWRKRERIFSVIIKATRHDQFLFLEIIDNGGTMSLTEIALYNGYIQASADEKRNIPLSGIGLKNIINRLDILYGKEAHISFDVRPSQYTRVIIKIPYQTPSRLLEKADV